MGLIFIMIHLLVTNSCNWNKLQEAIGGSDIVGLAMAGTLIFSCVSLEGLVISTGSLLVTCKSWLLDC